ncbi:hypothetical protein GH733_001544 [Mirounga leonina]|nr:hypothetical protein GH733_001544 [Mirounga leonina]
MRAQSAPGLRGRSRPPGARGSPARWPTPRGAHTRARTQTSPADADTHSPGYPIALPELDAPLATEPDHGPTGALARPRARLRRPSAEGAAAASRARLPALPASGPSRRPARHVGGALGRPAPAAAAAAAAGTHVPGAPPAPPIAPCPGPGRPGRGGLWAQPGTAPPTRTDPAPGARGHRGDTRAAGRRRGDCPSAWLDGGRPPASHEMWAGFQRH